MKQEQPILLAVLGIILTIAITLFGFKPALETYQTQRLQVAIRAREVADLDARRLAIEGLQNTLNQLASKVDDLNLAVPANDNYPELVTQLTGIASRAQVALISLQPVQGSQKTDVLGLTTTIRGTYPQILLFTDRLEHNLRPITIRSLNLAGGLEGASDSVLTATFQLGFARLPSAVSPQRGAQ